MNNFTLYDADTTDPIGPATEAQIAASNAAGDTGIILVAVDGSVLDPSYDRVAYRSVRRVYVS